MSNVSAIVDVFDIFQKSSGLLSVSICLSSSKCRYGDFQNFLSIYHKFSVEFDIVDKGSLVQAKFVPKFHSFTNFAHFPLFPVGQQ
jgi:hypothetical protein